MFRTFLTPLAAALAVGGCASLPLPHPQAAPAYERGMVSAADPRAAEAGAEMLRMGGSATDAAIATMLALTVVEPQSSGIGGGGFYVHGAPDGTVMTLDGRETAPSGATQDWFLDEAGKPLPFRQAVLSGLSVGVPGNLALAREAHVRHGNLAWETLFGPAIRLARDGWAITPRFNDYLTRRKDNAAHDPLGASLFFDAEGEPLPVGTRVANPQLAQTLETIARHGIGRFYNGALADEIAEKVAAETPREAAMTRADIAAYRVFERPAVCGHYRIYRICGMGPPSSGATTVLAMLGQLERFDMASLRADSPKAWHLFIESQRLAYADRGQYLADSDFVGVPVAGLIDPAYLAKRSALIDEDRAMPSVSHGNPAGAPADLVPGKGPEENGTSHFVAMDRAGNVVSYTSTVEGPFGSGIMAGGFYLNNELTDFSFVPEKDSIPVANRVEGGKRPRSSMAPTLVYGPDGKLLIAVGAAGGTTIPVQVARVLIGVLDWKMPVAQAVALPVAFAPGETVYIEEGSALEPMKAALEAMGHERIVVRELPLKLNAIEVVDGRPVGTGDPRSEGVAVAE